MTTLTKQRPTHSWIGERVEFGRYTLPDGQSRLVVGQRVNGVVRVTDVPEAGRARAYLIERGLEQDGHAALLALVSEYLQDAQRHATPMAANVLDRYLEAIR